MTGLGPDGDIAGAGWQGTGTPEDDAIALARGTSVNMGGFAARVLFAFLHSFVAARLYGAATYGAYAEGHAAVILLSVVARVGLGRTVTRFVAQLHARGQAREAAYVPRLALLISLPLSVVFGLAMSVWRTPVAALLSAPEAAPVFGVMGLALPVLNLGMLLAAFTQGLKQMRPKTLALDIVGPAIEFGAAIALAWLGFRQFGLALAYVLAAVMSAGMLAVVASGQVRRLHRMQAVRGRLPVGPILRFAVPMLALETLSNAGTRASILVVGTLGGSALVGVLSVLQRLSSVGTTFFTSLQTMLQPMVADLVERREMGRLSHLYKASTRWGLTVSLPIFLATGFFSTEILQVFGREFATGAGALPLLLAGQFFNVVTGACGVVLIMAGYPQENTVNQSAQLVLVSILSVLLIPRMGLLGAAYAFATGALVLNTLLVVQVWWHLRMHPYSASLLKVLAAAVAMSLTLWIWRSFVLIGTAGPFLPVAGCIVSLVSYMAVLLAVGLEPDDKLVVETVCMRLRHLLRWRCQAA